MPLTPSPGDIIGLCVCLFVSVSRLCVCKFLVFKSFYVTYSHYW